MRRRKTCLRAAFLCLKRLTNSLKYVILLKYRILGCRQAVRQRTLTPSPRGFESRQPSQKKDFAFLQSPFFNKINPFGICETALWAVRGLRTFIKRKTAGLRNHLAQQLRVFQHGARAQVVLVERLAVVVRHEERRLQDFEQCFFANVGIGIVDEHARVGVAAGVDIQVYAELFAMRDGRNYRENKSAGLP